MIAHEGVQWDERTEAIVTASYRWGYILVVFGLFLDVAYRGLFRNEAAWDLLGLAFVSSAVCTIYQVHHKVLGKAGAKWALPLMLLAGGIGAAAIAVGYATGLLH